MIIPDLPYADYISDYKEIADRHDLKMIMLITPETSEERIRQIDAHTSGFIYMVSSAATESTTLNCRYLTLNSPFLKKNDENKNFLLEIIS